MTKLVLPVKHLDAVLKFQHYIEASASQFALGVVLCGAELKALKKTIPHGEWESFFEGNLARKKFSLVTAQRYMRIAESIKAKASNLTLLDLAPSEMTDEQIALVAAEIGKLTDAPTWGALMSDLGLARLPHTPVIGGAAMVNRESLAAFLRNYYGHLEGTEWKDLPEDVQSHYKRWVAAFEAESRIVGSTPGNVKAHWYGFEREGWRFFVNGSKTGSGRDASRIGPTTEAYLQDLFFTNQRCGQAAIDKFLAEFRAGVAIPGLGSWRDFYPHRRECPPELPTGLHPRNLRRFLPARDEFITVAARQGRGAASEMRLKDLSGAQATQAALTGIAEQAEKVSASAGSATAGVAGAAEATGRFTDAAGKLREANGRFVKVGEDAEEAGKHLGNASHEADHFVASLKAGVGIDLGHRLIEGIAEIPAMFREALAEGVKFDQEMESLGLNLAGAFRAAAPEKYLNFSAAQAEGSRALDLLREKANALGLDMHALGESLSINLASLTHAGVTDLQQQISLITLLQQVTASKGISGFQATRDIIDLLNGQANRTILGKELEPLGVNNESIKQAKEQGQLYEFLTSKFGAYTEAAGAYANTFAAAQQRLTNETQQLYGEISRPVFEALKEAYQSLAEEIAKPEVREALRSLGYDLSTVVQAGAGLARFAIENAAVLVPLGAAIGVVTFALAAYKAAQIASIISGRLLALAAETEATAAQTLAVGADTAALEANTAAKVANAAVPAASGAGVAGGLMTGVGEASAATVGGVALAGLVPGAGIWAARQHGANREGMNDQEIGEDSSARSDRLSELQREIAAATTVEEQTKKRKELTDLLAASQTELNGLLAEQTKFYDDADNSVNGMQFDAVKTGKIENLQNYVQLLENANRESEKLAGSHPLADPKVARDTKALDAYHQSPEYLLEQAENSGDQQRIDDATYDEKVAKRKKKLTSGENPLSDEDAEREAQAAESADEDRKEREKDAKQKERDDAKTARDKEHADAKAARDARQEEDARDALHDAGDRASVNEARAYGHDDEADELDRQMRIREETLRLQKGSVTEAEAHAAAERAVNAEIAERNRLHDEHAAHHRPREPRQPRHRHGEREGVPTTGYHARPGDAGYAGVGSGGTDGFVDANPPQSSVAAMYGGVPAGNITTAAGKFAADQTAAGFAGAQMSAFLAGDLLGGPSTPTAAQSLAPLVAQLPAAGANANAGPVAGTTANGGDPVANAARDAAKSGASAADAARAAADGIEGIKTAFNQIATGLQKLRTDLDNAVSQIKHLP